VLRYLSLDWLDTLGAEVGASAAVQAAAGDRTIGVTQVVTGGPEGDVTYHMTARGGTVSFGAGPADDEDVRFVQDWDTAVGVAQGTMPAQEAFLRGRIRLHGDHRRLLDAQPLFAALDAVFAAVRDRTTYA
jgi:putative sterol carrier protein